MTRLAVHPVPGQDGNTAVARRGNRRQPMFLFGRPKCAKIAEKFVKQTRYCNKYSINIDKNPLMVFEGSI
ncbi:hypothetical protein [Thalassovita gelatinovora]|uniref:hypothetical protein n=1 Tax=Thalassovita gelatinovora TaxID=53501 RepID=UPI00071E490B|nr:hypothetical protein [Thalassovita gelatinovora]QIZ81611.1 hypothetical protein HFZ77_14545 [Thalassovita gelatinovora]